MSEKVENMLNLSLEVSGETRERSLSLDTGFDRENQTWEIIVRYFGEGERLREAFPDSPIVFLQAGYLIMEVTREELERLTAMPQVIYVEMPKAMHYQLDNGRRVSCITPLQPERETAPVASTWMGGGETVDGFSVKDTSESGVDLYEELQIDPDVHVKRDGSPVVLLYSTHASESFLLSDTDWYYTDDDFRSTEPDESILSVAAEAAAVIEAGGFGVIHDTTLHDYPAYSGSYDRSMETIRKNLEAYPTIQITVDVHRDAFGEDEDGTRYKPVAEVNGKDAAQIMILTGCDLSEDPLFPDWRENLHFALRLQQKGEALFPGLYRPLFFSQRNYNMHATHASVLVEVGTEVNTLSEAQYSGRLLGETILAVLNDLAE